MGKAEEEKARDAAALGLHESLAQHVRNSLEEAPAVQLSAECPGVAFAALGGLREIPPSALPLLLASPHHHPLLKTSFRKGFLQFKQQTLGVILIWPNLHKYSAPLFV